MRHNIHGVYYNSEKKRFQWYPRDLEENIFVLLPALAKAFDVKPKGNIYELEEGEYAINFS